MTDTPPRQVSLPIGLPALRRLPLPRKLGLLERLYGRKLARLGIALVATAPGPAWKLDLNEVTQRWIVYGDYEGALQMRWIRAWLRDGDTVVDSGANIGQMLLYFALAARVRIVAVEPLPTAQRWLKDCLALQEGWNVDLVACGLGAEPGVLPMQVEGARSTTRMDWYKSKSLESIEIKVERLDQVLEDLQVNRVRLWKLDVEGAECAAIQGARQALEEKRIDAVLVESAPASFAKLVEAFEQFGYGLFELDKRSQPVPTLGQKFTNLIALPAAGDASADFTRSGR